MKLARFTGGSTGLVVNGDEAQVVVDVAASIPALAASDEAAAGVLEGFFGQSPASWVPLISAWDRAREALRALQALAVSGGDGVVSQPLERVRLEAPLPDPGTRVFAIGGNFMDHIEAAARALEVAQAVVEAMKKGMSPWGFFIVPGTIVGPDAVVSPPAWCTKFDYEAEVAIVLQEGGSSIAADELRVWGYTAWNDFSIREQAFGLRSIDPVPLNWALQKNFDTGSSCGPWMVVDEPLVGGDLKFSLKVNGEQRQSSSTSEMLRSFAAVAEWVSGYITLVPGDMIASGTSMGTAVEGGLDGPYLVTGDVVEVEVEGVDGVLRNTIQLKA